MRLAIILLVPTALIAFLVAWLPAWLQGRVSAGEAVLRYGYLPEDRVSALGQPPSLRLVTVALRHGAPDEHQICTRPDEWAATLLAENDAAYWVLLRRVTPPDGHARVVRLPKTAYVLRPTPRRERPGNQDPWTRPACEPG